MALHGDGEDVHVRWGCGALLSRRAEGLHSKFRAEPKQFFLVVFNPFPAARHPRNVRHLFHCYILPHIPPDYDDEK